MRIGRAEGSGGVGWRGRTEGSGGVGRRGRAEGSGGGVGWRGRAEGSGGGVGRSRDKLHKKNLWHILPKCQGILSIICQAFAQHSPMYFAKHSSMHFAKHSPNVHIFVSNMNTHLRMRTHLHMRMHLCKCILCIIPMPFYIVYALGTLSISSFVHFAKHSHNVHILHICTFICANA